MKKSVFKSFVWLIIPSISIPTLVLLFYTQSKARENEFVDYLALVISIIILTTVLIIIVANFIARKLTGDILSSLDRLDFDSDNINLCDELTKYSAKVTRQKMQLNAKIEELSNRAETIEAITGNMREGLILVDNSGLVLSANKSALEIFGSNLERKSIKHICRDESFQDAIEKCIAGESINIKMERNTGFFAVFFSPVLSGSKTNGAVILLHDVTESHRAETVRREFSANVSHELKTPLTTISALAEMIAQDIAKADDVKNFAERINEQSGRLLVLIDDIIRLSEFDEQRLNEEYSTFDIWELAETVINSLQEASGSVELQLTGERINISANHRMIGELLYNLVDNAIRYNTDNGRVTVSLSLVDENSCMIAVTDTGIGISEEHHSRVFERFYRADKSRCKKTGGTGLGLSIVKHIAEYHDGSVSLESTVGAGTTIRVLLPVAR